MPMANALPESEQLFPVGHAEEKAVGVPKGFCVKLLKNKAIS
jgi:hypothetical protein